MSSEIFHYDFHIAFWAFLYPYIFKNNHSFSMDIYFRLLITDFLIFLLLPAWPQFPLIIFFYYLFFFYVRMSSNIELMLGFLASGWSSKKAQKTVFGAGFTLGGMIMWNLWCQYLWVFFSVLSKHCSPANNLILCLGCLSLAMISFLWSCGQEVHW